MNLVGVVFRPQDGNFAQKLIPKKKGKQELNFKIILPELEHEEFEEYHPSSVLPQTYNCLLEQRNGFRDVQGGEGGAGADLQEQGKPGRRRKR